MEGQRVSNRPDEPRQTRQNVIQELEEARAELEAALRPLNERQLTATPFDGWTVKDHLGHLAAWAEGMAALLRRQPRYQAMGIQEAVDNNATETEINAILHMVCKDCSLETVRANFDRVHQSVLAAIRDLSDAELYESYGYFQPQEAGEDNGHPILDWIRGNTSEHYREHVVWIRERFPG